MEIFVIFFEFSVTVKFLKVKRRKKSYITTHPVFRGACRQGQ